MDRAPPRSNDQGYPPAGREILALVHAPTIYASRQGITVASSLLTVAGTAPTSALQLASTLTLAFGLTTRSPSSPTRNAS